MGSILECEVAQHCWTVCTINLQYLKEIFKNIWAFAIPINAGNNARTAYLDIRMWCYFKGTLQNLHILAIPMHEWHTRGYQYDLVVQTMDFLAPDWRHQLIGITTEVFQITMDGLISSSSAEDKEAYENIVSMIANFSLQMVVGISKVCTEYDNRNNLGDQSPPILPLDLCALLSR